MPTNCCMVAAQWWQQQRGTCRQAASNTNYRGDWECWSDLAALRSTLSHSEFSHYSPEKEKKNKNPFFIEKGQWVDFGDPKENNGFYLFFIIFLK